MNQSIKKSMLSQSFNPLKIMHFALIFNLNTEMPKRKLEDFKDDSQFRFWGIVISQFVWNMSRSTVLGKFGCTEAYVTKVVNKFD